MLITQNLNNSNFTLVSAVTKLLPYKINRVDNVSDTVTLIGHAFNFLLLDKVKYLIRTLSSNGLKKGEIVSRDWQKLKNLLS